MRRAGSRTKTPEKRRPFRSSRLAAHSRGEHNYKQNASNDAHPGRSGMEFSCVCEKTCFLLSGTICRECCSDGHMVPGDVYQSSRMQSRQGIMRHYCALLVVIQESQTLAISVDQTYESRAEYFLPIEPDGRITQTLDVCRGARTGFFVQCFSQLRCIFPVSTEENFVVYQQCTQLAKLGLGFRLARCSRSGFPCMCRRSWWWSCSLKTRQGCTAREERETWGKVRNQPGRSCSLGLAS